MKIHLFRTLFIRGSLIIMMERHSQHHSQSLLIVAGESSGDLLGGALVESLRRLDPEFTFWGIGGSALRASGVETVFSIDDLGVTGFTEVLGKIRYILGVMKQIVEMSKVRCPVAAIMIDYPDFNLRLAVRLKKLGIPVLYYVSPQMWAWRSGRIAIVRKYIDRMMVLLPFEEEWYRERNANAVFVGHPVLDRIDVIPERSECRRVLGIKDSELVIAILPGSRRNEVRRILPVMMRAQNLLMRWHQEMDKLHRKIRFIIPLADTISRSDIIASYHLSQPEIDVIQGKTLQVVRAADFAWVTSGTAALETALLGTPHIVVYRTSPLSYHLARLMVKVDKISIANLVIKEAVVPELIQDAFSPDRVVSETRRLLYSHLEYVQFRKRLTALSNLFGQHGASDRAAAVVYEFLSSVNASQEKTKI